VKFRRQQPIGPYIVDFVSFEHRLIIEVDGSQHGEDDTKVADQARTAWFEDQSYRVLRFWNNEVLTNIEGVFEAILAAVVSPSPQPSPIEGDGVSTSTSPSPNSAT
jgi:very-short-patch-repair endonuclease